MNRRRLPRLTVWLLSACAPAETRAELLDDLEEEFGEIESRAGRAEARRWLRRQLQSADWLRLRFRRPSSPNASTRLNGRLPRSTRSDPLTRLLLDDLRSALRALGRQPRYALSAMATVAVGILGATTMLGALESVLLKPLPWDMDRLVALRTSNRDGDVTSGPVSWINLNEWRELEVFDGVLAVQGAGLTLRGRGPAEALSVARVNVDALSVLGVAPVIGRGFRPSEGMPGKNRVALLTYARWTSMFDGAPDAIGQTLRLDDEPYEVIGVLPAAVLLPNDMEGAGARDLWVPLAPELGEMPRERRAVMGYARLADGVSRREAQAALDAAFAGQREFDPEANDGWQVRVETVTETLVGPFRTVLWMMLGAALLLLLLACANLTNLMLAHWARRRHDLAVQAALGAGRGRIIRHLLAQGLLIGLAGGAIGVLGSHVLLALVTRLTPGDVPRLDEAAVTARIAITTLAGAGALGMAFAGGPALLFAGRASLVSSYGAGRASTVGRWEHRTLGGMVTVQIALAVTLLTGTGLLGRSFLGLVGVHPGFDIDRVVTSLVLLTPPQYPDEGARTRFTREALERFASLPGVTRVGVTNFLPYSGTNTVDGFSVNGLAATRQTVAGYRAVDDGYFDVLDIPIIRGRAFTAREVSANAPVALVSETMARQHFGETDPIGLFIQRGSPARDSRGWREIVGVVGDVRHEAPDQPVIAEWYAPYAGDAYSLKFFVLKTSVPADVAVSGTRAALGDLDPDIAPVAVQTMATYLEEHVAGPRFNVAMLAAFGATAIVIAAVGLFGVIANAVAARLREFGIRIALGASRRRIRNQLLRHAMTLTLPGIVFGLLGAAWLSGLLASVLRGVSPLDAPTYATVTILTLVVVLVVGGLPARRATSVDPSDALRVE